MALDVSVMGMSKGEQGQVGARVKGWEDDFSGAVSGISILLSFPHLHALFLAVEVKLSLVHSSLTSRSGSSLP